LQPEYPLSYGNISGFSIFRLRARACCAIVVGGRGMGPRTKSATLSNHLPSEKRNAKEHDHGHEEEEEEQEGGEEVLIGLMPISSRDRIAFSSRDTQAGFRWNGRTKVRPFCFQPYA
jgi:hypothetical protein